MGNKNVIVERVFNTNVDLAWKALTDTELMKQWYINVEEFKPVVGFKFEFWGGEEGQRKWKHLCEIIEVIKDKKLTYSWKYEGYSGLSFVTFELFKMDIGTKLKLTHSGIDTFPVDITELAIDKFESGWKQIINISLKEFLEKDVV